MGLKYLMWFSVPYVGKMSRAWELFKDKLLYWNEFQQAGILDIRYPKVREYLKGIYGKAVKEWGIDGLKLDFIDEFYLHPDSPSFSEGMDYADVQEALDVLLTEVMEELTSVRPDILIEFRQRYIGPQIRKYGNLLRVSDCPGSGISNRVGIVDLRLLSGKTAVHSDMLMWHEAETAQDAALQVLSCIFSTVQISVSLDKLTEEMKKMLLFWMAFMQEHKQLLQESQIKPQEPENLYPQVMVEDEKIQILVQYSRGRTVDLRRLHKCMYYIHAVKEEEVCIRLGVDSYSFKAANVDLAYLESDNFLKKCSSLRGSVMLIGPMVARFGKAMISKPGGDKIGRRRLDTHFIGIQNLGADFTYNEEREIYEISAEELKGTSMLLDEASVTGTANIVMAAVLAKGKTTIYNAACEPYLQQLCKMLNRMGAKISGIASNLLTIEGVEELHGTDHTVLPDMIEVGSFIGMAAMTRSEITIKNVSYENLGIIPESFRRLGIKLEQRGDDIFVPAQDCYQIESFIDGSIMTIADAPWPGLTPDLLSVMLVVATQAKGSVLIHQKMFESRLFFVDKLIDMGAQIILCDPHRAVVIGHNHGFTLRGGNMTSPDIRAGIALLIAAMSAEGISRIHNIEQIDRGYQNIEGRLNAIGARITRI